MVGVKINRRMSYFGKLVAESEGYKYIGSLRIKDESLLELPTTKVANYFAHIYEKFYIVFFSSSAGEEYSDCDIFVKRGE